MIIGDRIKKARLEKSYTQDHLGDLIGVSKVSICGYEKGTRTPTMAVFLKLGDVLDITVDYMLGNDIKIIKEAGEPYTMSIAKEDLEIIKELKTNRELYNQLCVDPKRTVQLIIRKLK
ncbi:MAG: helix-turn-helix transcriptional regulator [Bacilli bacterium]